MSSASNVEAIRFAVRNWVCVAGLCLTLISNAAVAHVIMGTKSLHLRVAEAEFVVRARVTDPGVLFVLDEGGGQRRLVEIEIIETLKGEATFAKVRFAQNGHDVATYQAGEIGLFFLSPIEKSRELRALAVLGGPTHFSNQEARELYRTDSERGKIFLSAARGYAGSESAGTADERVSEIRKATLDLLTSGDAELGAMALASLVLSPRAELITRADVPRLEALLGDSRVSVGFRAGLIAELERRGLIDGATHWMALLQSTDASDQRSAIRAVGLRPSPSIKLYLVGRLADPSTPHEIAAEAAIALGASRDPDVVSALAQALSIDDGRVRNAAVRALGDVGGPEARRVLEQAADSHPDTETRRRAMAETRLLATRATKAAER
jgi:hypothetical protein